jgi:hypothetical protein
MVATGVPAENITGEGYSSQGLIPTAIPTSQED